MSNNSNPQVVAVADAHGDFVGSIVWWRLSGGLDLEQLYECWERAGLPKQWLPEEPSCERAFRRACKAQKEPRVLVRPLEGGKGFAIVREHAKGDDLSHNVALRFTLDVVKRVRATGPDGTLLPIGANKTVDVVRDAYRYYQDNLMQQDVSSWLCKMMDKLGAVTLRDTGGVYFIPAHSLAKWEEMCRCIKGSKERPTSAHAMLGVPAVRTDQAVEAALDAIAHESTQAADKLEKVLDAHLTGESDDDTLGAKALGTRVKRAEGIEAKLSQYEQLLGAKLPELHERLEALRANLVLAQMQAEES
jgi:hypothetical protein